MKPPSELDSRPHLKLVKSTLYGIVPAGRKWELRSDEDVRNVLDLEAVFGLPQLCVRRENGVLVLVVAKYVDDILISAFNEEWLSYCRNGLEQSYEVGSWLQFLDNIDINVTKISQDA